MATDVSALSSASTASAALFTTLGTTTPSANQAVNELDAINEQVAQIAKDMKASGPIGDVEDFQKTSYDVQLDNNMTARDIGVLRENDSRLNLFSSLSTGDKVDVYRMKVATTALTTVGSLVGEAADKDSLRIQLFSKDGKLVVDNDVDAGDARSNYLLMTQGALELQQGDYVVRVSRISGIDPQAQKAMQYAIQFSQGGYKRDFDTVEQGKNPDADAYGFTGLGAATISLLDGLGAGYSFIANLSPIGTSATAKLSGLMLDSVA
jgi:hypothetical protein